jgi:glycerol uptake facilitator-like aquaporin
MRVVIVWLGPLSGGSGNPARQFGPALFAGADLTLTAYLTAPLLGAVAAAGLHRLLLRRRPVTHRLCGTSS